MPSTRGARVTLARSQAYEARLLLPGLYLFTLGRSGLMVQLLPLILLLLAIITSSMREKTINKYEIIGHRIAEATPK
jgi:hypothetical protein